MCIFLHLLPLINFFTILIFQQPFLFDFSNVNIRHFRLFSLSFGSPLLGSYEHFNVHILAPLAFNQLFYEFDFATTFRVAF